MRPIFRLPTLFPAGSITQPTLLMRAFLIALGALLALLGASSTSAQAAIDPAVCGLWAPASESDYTAGELDFFPDGTFVEREVDTPTHTLTTLYTPKAPQGKRPFLQWTVNGTVTKPSKVQTGTATFDSGKFNLIFNASSKDNGKGFGTNSGSYEISSDGHKMTLDLGGGEKLELRRVADATGTPAPRVVAPKSQTTPVDPDLVGLWAERVATDKGYNLVTVFAIYPNGQFIVHIQHPTDQSIYVGGSSQDVETDNDTIVAFNGRYTVTTSDGTSVPASYVISKDKQKMIVEYDSDTYGFLFVHEADINAQGDLIMQSGGTDPATVHYVDPKLVRVWAGQLQENGASYITDKLIEWHPDGKFVLHIRHITASQSPMDVKDFQTYPGEYDAFRGRFLLDEPNYLRETGTYSVNGNILDIHWDTNKTGDDQYSLYGDFDANGNIHPFASSN